MSLSLAVTLPALIVMWVVPAWILGSFGETYQERMIALRIVLVGQLANVLTGPVGPLMIVTDQHDFYVRTTAIAVTVGTVTMVGLYGSLEIAGIALGTVAGLVLLSVTLSLWVQAAVGLRAYARPAMMAGLAGAIGFNKRRKP